MLPIRSRIPWYFRLARARISRGRRGGYFVLRMIRRLNLMNQCALFPLANDEQVLMPLYWPRLYQADRFSRYEPDAIRLFAEWIASAPEKVVMVDCGADVGLFTRLVLAQTRNVAMVYGFEPNPRSFFILRRNLDLSGMPTKLMNAGVSDYNGFARLSTPEYHADDHAKFLTPADQGVPVCTIDSIGIPGGTPLALKVDVEGQELNVLHGAAKTIAAASRFVIQVEGHRDVAQRTEIDPIECLRFVNSIRQSRFVACEENTRSVYRQITLDRGLFDQFPQHRVLDVIIESR